MIGATAGQWDQEADDDDDEGDNGGVQLERDESDGFACYCLFDGRETMGLRSVGATLKQTRG